MDGRVTAVSCSATHTLIKPGVSSVIAGAKTNQQVGGNVGVNRAVPAPGRVDPSPADYLHDRHTSMVG